MIAPVVSFQIHTVFWWFLNGWLFAGRADPEYRHKPVEYKAWPTA